MVALNISNVSFTVGGKEILNHVNMAIMPGETVALIGHNGSGKTTLLEIVLGQLNPTTGKVELHPSLKRKGVVLDTMGFLQLLKVREIIHYFSTIHSLKPHASSTKELIKALDLDSLMDSMITTLSQGERKKVGILLALIHDPDFLIMDEPFANLDPLILQQLISNIKREGRTVLFTTNEWEIAKHHADKICMLNKGTVVGTCVSPLEMVKQIPSDQKIITEYTPSLIEALKGATYYVKDNQIHFFTNESNEMLKLILKHTKNFSVTTTDLVDYYLLKSF